MSDTPRTEVEHKYFFSSINGMRDPSRDYVPIDFARQLERELAAVTKERDDALALLGCYKMYKDELNARIEALKKERDELRVHCTIADQTLDEMYGLTTRLGEAHARIKQLEEAGDMMVQHFYTDEHRSVMWEKAKEARENIAKVVWRRAKEAQ
jgi:chromosome segregation ATPase